MNIEPFSVVDIITIGIIIIGVACQTSYSCFIIIVSSLMQLGWNTKVCKYWNQFNFEKKIHISL